VLGQVVVDFPACPWKISNQDAVNFTMHVDIWTVLPILPPLLASGFDVQLSLSSLAALSSSKNTALQQQLCMDVSLAQPPESGALKSQDVCLMDDPRKAEPSAYPPVAPSAQIPVVTIDLDKPASERWVDIVTPRKEAIKDLIDTFMGNIMKRNGTARELIMLLINGVAEQEMKRMPTDFAEEMKAIAKATHINIGAIWVLNMMYEITGSCTSFITQDDAGHIWHGRNLDFGLFMGTDSDTHTWQLPEKLRKIMVNVQFERSGKILYNATTYAGFIGLLSGTSNHFSITVNTRYDGSFLAGIIGWFLGKNNDCQFLTFQTRMVMELNTTYTDALSSLVYYKPLGPAYIIIGGIKADEGAVIAKEFNSSAEIHGRPWPNHDVWFMNESISKDSFYVAETNYDRLKAPPEFDDRRYPMENCLEKVGTAGINASSIWKILSSNPTKNGLTTFSTVMSAGNGHFEAYLQLCDPGPKCVPF